MRVGHIERAGFDRARHRTACFRTAGERHVACRIAIYGFLGYRIRVRIVVQVLLGKTFERPRLRVAAVGSHGLHHQLFGHVFRFVGAAALRLFAGSPNMEGQRLRPFAIVVILIVPRFVHRDACRFRLPNVQYREFGAVDVRTFDHGNAVFLTCELLGQFLVNRVVVPVAVRIISGQIGPRVRPVAGVLVVQRHRVLRILQLLGVAQQVECHRCRTLRIVVVGPDFAHAHHGGVHAVFHTNGVVVHQSAVHVCFTEGDGEVDRVRLFIPDRRLGFGELVDAVLQLELFRQSAATRPGDFVDRLAFESFAGYGEFRSSQLAAAADLGFGEQDAAFARLVLHDDGIGILLGAVDGHAAVEPDAEYDVIRGFIAVRRHLFTQGVGAG